MAQSNIEFNSVSDCRLYFGFPVEYTDSSTESNILIFDIKFGSVFCTYLGSSTKKNVRRVALRLLSTNSTTGYAYILNRLKFSDTSFKLSPNHTLTFKSPKEFLNSGYVDNDYLFDVLLDGVSILSTRNENEIRFPDRQYINYDSCDYVYLNPRVIGLDCPECPECPECPDIPSTDVSLNKIASSLESISSRLPIVNNFMVEQGLNVNTDKDFNDYIDDGGAFI